MESQGGDQLQLTAAGQETLDKLTTASHDSLAELLDGWSPEQEAELATLLHRAHCLTKIFLSPLQASLFL